MNGRACGALCLTAVAASVITGAGIGRLFRGGGVTAEELSQSHNRVSAEECRLVDKGGRTRAWRGTHLDGYPGLSLLGDKGTRRAQLLLLSGAGRGCFCLTKTGMFVQRFSFYPVNDPP